MPALPCLVAEGVTPGQVVEHGGHAGPPSNRATFGEKPESFARVRKAAIRTVAPYALENISTCYRIDFSAVAVGRVKGRTIYVAIKAPIVRVVHDEAFVVLPGFRMSYRPVETEIDVACSIALANFARDDFASADFEYLYAGPGASGGREFRSIRGKDRKIFDRVEVDGLLDIYVRGVGLALDAGLDIREPDLRGYRIIDPDEPSLFT